MHEIVKLYDLLVDHNEMAHESNRLSFEINTHPLQIRFWWAEENDYKDFMSFQSANKWLESRILGVVKD